MQYFSDYRKNEIACEVARKSLITKRLIVINMTIWETGKTYKNKHNGKRVIVQSNYVTDEGYLLWEAFYLPRAEEGRYEMCKVLSEMDAKHWVKEVEEKPKKNRIIMQTKFTKVRMLRNTQAIKGDEEE